MQQRIDSQGYWRFPRLHARKTKQTLSSKLFKGKMSASYTQEPGFNPKWLQNHIAFLLANSIEECFVIRKVHKFERFRIFPIKIRFFRVFSKGLPKLVTPYCGGHHYKGGSYSPLARSATSSGPSQMRASFGRSVAFVSMGSLRTKGAVQGCQPLPLKYDWLELFRNCLE